MFPKLFLLFCLMFCRFVHSNAQNIELNETMSIKTMMEVWANQNRTTAQLEGWRILVASSTDRFEVQAKKDQFVALYPSISADWYQEKPYYKLKAGAFKHSWEARKMINQISSDFSGAYPVIDKKIKPSDFLPLATE